MKETFATSTGEVAGRRRFPAFLTGMGLSLLGSQAWFVALAWAASQLGDARAMSWVMAVASLPRAVLILPAGPLVDRWGPRRVTLGSDAARAIVMGAAAVVLVAFRPGLALLLVVGAVFGVIDALHMPALGSLPPRMLTGERLAAGQGMVQTVQRAVSVAASPLGGAVVAAGGLAWVLAMDVALFAAAFLVLHAVPADQPPETAGDTEETGARPAGSPWRALLDGWRVAWADSVIRGVLIAVTVLNLVAGGALNVGVAQLAHDRHFGSAGFGLLMAGFAAGAVAGALLISAIRPARHPVRNGLVWTLLGGAAVAATGLPASLPAAIACLVALGIAMGPASALLLGTVQARCPTAYLGRVMSLVGFSAVGLAPVSMIGFGQLTDRAGITTAFTTTGACLAATALIALTSRALRNATTTTHHPEA